ncbi:sensor histidine kinase [Thalassotalea euphylliae]|uniref:sensor histidine kinase n=1 Tax=Thalassotalea euphylliae TaxID=1655234 RepID=UPI00362C5F07
MPDQGNEASIVALQDEIKLLSNALKRERSVNKKLQQKLEDNAQINYDNNKEFVEAYEQASLRQIQLQFLSTLTANIYEEHDLRALASIYLSNIATFVDIKKSLVFESLEGNVSISTFTSENAQLKEIDDVQNTERVFNYLASELSHTQGWLRLSEQHTQIVGTLLDWQTQLSPIACLLEIAEDFKLIVVLDASHYCYSEDFQQTMDMSCQQFQTALQRRHGEIELAYNYHSLTSTVAELKLTQRQLIQNEKMASLGQLAAGVAHEINNPLGYVASNLESLKEYVKIFESALPEKVDDPAIQHELEFAKEDTTPLIDSCTNGLKRIADIVQSLKNFSRSDSNTLSDVDVNQVLEDSLQIVWNQLKYQHTVDKRLDKNLPLIHGNDGQLQQVFVNLMVNAAQAMPDGGKLTITSETDDDYVVVKIKDNGKGMSAETKAKLFEPFFTTKSHSGGTGLGLSVSYAILEKHSAEVDVDTVLDEGTTFTIRLRIHPA